MSSPIHHAEDLDAALMYAPPCVRKRARDGAQEAARPEPIAPVAEPPIEALPRRWRIGGPAPAFSGDREVARLQRQLALYPDAIPQPPVDAVEPLWPILLRIGGVAGAAALVAWLMVALPGGKLQRNETKSADAPPPPPPPATMAAVDSGHEDAARYATALLVQHGLAETNAPAQPNDAPPLATPQPVLAPVAVPVPVPVPAAPAPAPAPGAISPPADSVHLQLGNDEIATLVKRGKDFVTNGDLASARLLLRRAAEAGSAEAALALGATFDPLVLRRLGAIGAVPDTAQARTWYQRAADLGSDAASQQLAKLAPASR
jgi:hypothetical protein